jgi:hypothetical protein
VEFDKGAINGMGFLMIENWHIRGNKFEAELVEHGFFERIFSGGIIFSLPFEFNVKIIDKTSPVENRDPQFVFA